MSIDHQGITRRAAVWTYGGTVPGPELRLKQGERLRVELENLLSSNWMIHCHILEHQHAGMMAVIRVT